MVEEFRPVAALRPWVDACWPVLPLWNALGFTSVAEIPDENQLGFVILQNGPVEVMYQTVASVRAD